MLSLEKPQPDELKRSWKDILHVGIPAAGTNAIVPIGVAVITAMVARYGPEADRILQALRLCMLFSIGSGLVIALVLAVFAGYLPTLFSDSTAVISIAKIYLWIAPIGYGAYGVVMVMNASFNGMGHPMPGVAISVGRMLVLYVPLASAGMVFLGSTGIFAAYPVANILSGVLAYGWARRKVREALA